jgi:hypothetical protein
VVTTLTVGYVPPQIVVTYNPSVHAVSTQDIANDAPPLVVSFNRCLL